MFEKKIIPKISADNTTLTIAKSSAISAPTQSPSAVQNSTYMGRVVTHPSSTPLTNMTPTYLPPTYVEPSGSSQSGGSVVPPYSSLVLQANSTSRSMYDVNVIKSVVNIANLSEENIKRRSFFFLLKDRLTEYISSTPFITCFASTYDNTGLSSECNQTDCPSCCFVGMASVDSPNTCGVSESEGVRQFATRLALGLSYIYQDIIPLLDTESNKRLTEYFVYFIHSYFMERHYGWSHGSMRTLSVYSILMNSLNEYLPESQNCNVKNLKTVDGFTFSFNHILSLGVLTPDGGLYEAKNPRNVQLFKELKDRNNFPLYRWGTSDVIKLDLLGQAQNSIDLQEVEDSVSAINIGLPMKKIDWVSVSAHRVNDNRKIGVDYLPNAFQGNLFKEFWSRADDLANSYLSQDEFRSYTQLIPAGSSSGYLLKEVGTSEGGGGGSG